MNRKSVQEYLDNARLEVQHLEGTATDKCLRNAVRAEAALKLARRYSGGCTESENRRCAMWIDEALELIKRI